MKFSNIFRRKSEDSFEFDESVKEESSQLSHTECKRLIEKFNQASLMHRALSVDVATLGPKPLTVNILTMHFPEHQCVVLKDVGTGSCDIYRNVPEAVIPVVKDYVRSDNYVNYRCIIIASDGRAQQWFINKPDRFITIR